MSFQGVTNDLSPKWACNTLLSYNHFILTSVVELKVILQGLTCDLLRNVEMELQMKWACNIIHP